MTILSKSIVKVYQRSLPKKAYYLFKGLNYVYWDGLLADEKDPFPDNFFCFSQGIDFISFPVNNNKQGIQQVEAYTSHHIQRAQSQFPHQLLNILFFTLILQNWNNEKMKVFLTEILPKQKVLLSNQVFNWSQNFHELVFYKEAITSLLSFLAIEDTKKQYIWPDTLKRASVIKDFIDILLMPNIHTATLDEKEENPEKWIISQDELWNKTILDLSFPETFFLPSKKGLLIFIQSEDSGESFCIPLIYDSKLSWKDSLTIEVRKDLTFAIKECTLLPSMYNEDYLFDGIRIPLGAAYKEILLKITDNFGKSDLKLFTYEDIPIDEETKNKLITLKGITRDKVLLTALPKEVSDLLIPAFATICHFLETEESRIKVKNLLTRSLEDTSFLDPLKPYLKTEIGDSYLCEEYYTLLKQWHADKNGTEKNNRILEKNELVYNRDSLIKNILVGFYSKYPFLQALSEKQQTTLESFNKTYFYQKKKLPNINLFWLTFFSEDFGFVENLLSSGVTLVDYLCLIIAMLLFRFLGGRLILFLLGCFLQIQVRLLECYFKVPQNEILPSLFCALVIPGGFKLAQQYFSFKATNTSKHEQITSVIAGGGCY